MPLRRPRKATIPCIEVDVARVDLFPQLQSLLARLEKRPDDAAPLSSPTDGNLIVLSRKDFELLLLEAGRPASGGALVV